MAQGRRDPLDPRGPLLEEPTNAELARMILQLADRIGEDRKHEEDFHNQLLGRIDGQNSALVTLQQQVAVDRAKTEAAINALSTRADTHDQFHQNAEKSEKERADGRTQNLVLLMGIVTIVATFAGSILHVL